MKKTIKVEGGYSEPKVLDLLIFQLLLIPIKIVQFMSFYIRSPFFILR